MYVFKEGWACVVTSRSDYTYNYTLFIYLYFTYGYLNKVMFKSDLHIYLYLSICMYLSIYMYLSVYISIYISESNYNDII